MVINEVKINDEQLMRDHELNSPEELIIFKMITGTPMTQEEVGKILGITKMGVCKIEMRALRKLRTALAQKGLKSVDDMLEPTGRTCASCVSASGAEVFGAVAD